MRRIRLNLRALRARNLPRLLRPGLSAEQLLNSSEALTLSRRRMLGLAGAAAMTLPLQAAADARAFQFVAGRKRVAFRVQGRDMWVIDTRRFSGNPQLRTSRSEDLIRVELKDARYPGTDIPADLVCELKRGVVGWQMHLRMAYGGFESRTPFTSWLEGGVPARSRVRIDGRICSLGSSANLAACGSVQAEFFPNWTLHLTGRGVAKLSGVAGGASSDSLAVSLLSGSDASLLRRPPAQRTLLAMNRGDRAWKFGRDFGREESWDLVASDAPFDVIHIETGEGSWGESGRALLAESRGDEPAFSFLPGERFTASDGARFQLPLRNVRYAISFDGDRDESAFVADYDPEPSWLHTEGCSFEIGGGAEGRPFEVTQSRGKAAQINCAPGLRRIAAPLPGAIAEPGAVQEGTLLAFALDETNTKVQTLAPGALKTVGTIQVPATLFTTPSFSVAVTRPDDLLALNFDFFNLNLTAGTGGPSLVRVYPGQPAYMVVDFSPQHIVEEAFADQDPPIPLPKNAEPPILARLAGPSRLAFLIPEATLQIPYSLSTLLNWSTFEQSVTALATPPPKPLIISRKAVTTLPVTAEPRVSVAQSSMDYYKAVQSRAVQPAAVQPVKKPKKGTPAVVANPTASTVVALADLLRVKEPELFQTAIEAPYRLILSPNYYAGWAHAALPVVQGGRTELWHTRLGVRTQPGQVDENNQYYRTVRAVWAKDYQAGCPSNIDTSPFLTSPTTSQRTEIVRLSADQSITLSDGKPYQPVPITVYRLMLSTLGAWIDLDGAWDPPEDVQESGCATKFSLNVEHWRHIAAMGRDQYVRVVLRGYLFPFGHRAVKVIITERKFNRTPVSGKMGAYLRQKVYVLVREHEKTYPATGQPHPNGPRLPFQTVRINTLGTPALSKRVALLSVDPNYNDVKQQASNPNFEPVAFYPQVSGVDFQFQMQGVDWEGKTCEFSTPLIFVETDPGRNLAVAKNLISLYGSDPATARRKRPFSGQVVAYAKNNKPGDTAFETNTITFAGELPDVNASLPADQASFYPALQESEVRIATVEQLTGTSATTSISYPDAYLASGFDATANKGQVFAQLVNTVGLQFGSAGATSDKVGGLLTPSMTISGLSRSLGPIAGTLTKMVAGNFDPTDIFNDALNATLLGEITLKDVIATVADFSGALEKVPKFITTHLPNAIQTTFTWQPQIQNVSLAGDEFFVVTGDTTKALTLSATLTKPLDNTPPSYQVSGTLQNFEIHLVPGVMELMVASFNSMSFTAVNGKKPDFSVNMGTVQFEGPLSFINALQSLIPSSGFSDPPSLDVTSNGIEMGYTLGLPPVGIGIFSLSNLSLGAILNVYFINQPITFEFDFCTEDQPFLLTVMVFGGGGYFDLTVSPQGIVEMSGGLDFGGSFALDLGVASGGVYVLAGVSYTYDQTTGSALTGYLKCGGSLNVLDIISISVEFDMSLTYYSDGNRIHGEATLTVSISILFFSVSVDLTVQRDFAGGGSSNAALLDGGAPYPLGPTTVGFADQMSATDWQTYCQAFA
jgi:hypothetical protein